MATADYKIIPDQTELDQIPRDLHFYPSTVTEPKTLSSEQVAGYNRDGFVTPVSVFNAEEIAGIRSYFDDLLAQVIASGKDSYSISSAHLRYGKCYDLLTHPKIVACVKDILGENVVGWGSHFFCKMPRDGKAVAWHQDASYWPLTPSKAVTVWLAIDDADIENACVKFIAGSQHSGHLTFRESSPEEHNVLNQTVENPEQYGATVYNILKAGQMSLHSDLLLHGSDGNTSDRRRCGLTLRYASTEVKAYQNWNDKGVLVSGSDPSGNWSNRSRPEVD